MRPIYLQMQMSFDGYVVGPDGAMDWVDTDPVMGQAHTRLAEEASLTLIGHGVGSGMAQFWPQAEDDSSFPDNERAFARLMNRIPKAIVSTRTEELGWNNATQLLGDDEDALVARIGELKAAGEGYLLCYGGVRTAQMLLRHGLVDELHLDVPPVVLGGGERLFTDRLPLELLRTTRYDSGAVGVVYRPGPAD